MAEGALELRQGQSLVMTQQLRQSIQLLQLSTVDLNGFIDAEMEKNPLRRRPDMA
jgi:RNA polymerase sigma-54 factor